MYGWNSLAYYINFFDCRPNFNSPGFRTLFGAEKSAGSQIFLNISKNVPGVINRNSRYLYKVLSNELKVRANKQFALLLLVNSGWSVNLCSPLVEKFVKISSFLRRRRVEFILKE